MLRWRFQGMAEPSRAEPRLALATDRDPTVASEGPQFIEVFLEGKKCFLTPALAPECKTSESSQRTAITEEGVGSGGVDGSLSKTRRLGFAWWVSRYADEVNP